MENAGFKTFGWVLPDERPEGTPITEDLPYPHGGFLYEMQGGKPPTFFALLAPTDEQMAFFAEKEKYRHLVHCKQAAKHSSRLEICNAPTSSIWQRAGRPCATRT